MWEIWEASDQPIHQRATLVLHDALSRGLPKVSRCPVRLALRERVKPCERTFNCPAPWGHLSTTAAWSCHGSERGIAQGDLLSIVRRCAVCLGRLPLPLRASEALMRRCGVCLGRLPLLLRASEA